jgi:hypothetical protein
MERTTRKSVVRRTLLWLVIAVVAIGGSLGFEHDTSARGVLLDQSALVKNDGTCSEHGVEGAKKDCEPCPLDHSKNCHKACVDHNGQQKKDCVPCPDTNKDGEPHECHPSCQKGNGDPKKDCVPCTDKKGRPKDCKPCKGEDKKGNPKPKHCVVSGSTVTSEEGTVAGE